MSRESLITSSLKNTRLLLAAGAAVLAGVGLMVSALCRLWLRYTIVREVRIDQRGELLFLLVNTHTLSLLLGWLIIFFALFLRRRLERRADSETAWRIRSLTRLMTLLLAAVIIFNNLILPEISDSGKQTSDKDIPVAGVELAAPMNAVSVKRQASDTRPAWEFSTNAYGFRDRAIDAQADAAKKRIMLVGDSFVFGSGIAQNECLNPILESELNGRLRGRAETRVYSVAQEGWNLEQEVSAIIAMVPIIKPDLVLISHLPGNDLWPRDPMFSSQWRNGTFQKALFEMRARQIELFRDREYTYPDLLANYHHQMKRLEDWALSNGVDVLIYTHGICTYQMDGYLESGRIFVQHFTQWSLEPANLIKGDGHPTGQGNLALARMLSPYIMEILQLRDNEAGSGFNLKARQTMRSMWPDACGPLGKVAYQPVWVISQDKTPLIRDLIEADWLEQNKLAHINSRVDESSVRLTFADGEKRQFDAVLQKTCPEGACKPCADACICFENAAGDTTALQKYVCSRLPQNLWDQRNRPVENNPRDVPPPAEAAEPQPVKAYGDDGNTETQK